MEERNPHMHQKASEWLEWYVIEWNLRTTLKGSKTVKLGNAKCLAHSHIASNFQIEFWLLCKAHTSHYPELSYLEMFMRKKTHLGGKDFQAQHLRGPLDQFPKYCRDHSYHISEGQSASFRLNPSKERRCPSFHYSMTCCSTAMVLSEVETAFL